MTGAMNQGAFKWSPEAIERMCSLRTQGQSSKTIAIALAHEFQSPVSRSAVIGKLHRLGIKYEAPRRKERVEAGGRSGRQIQAMRQARMRADQATISHPLRVASVRLVESADAISLTPRAILDPLFGGCRWPLELTSPTGDTMFCCNDRGQYRPYCEAHMARAFQATRPDELRAQDNAILAQRRAQAAADGRAGFTYARAAS